MSPPKPHGLLVLVLLPLVGLPPSLGAADGQFELRVVDKATQQPIACRMHLKDARGKVVIPPKSVSWKDHFVWDGQIVLDLKAGMYHFELEHGPEYRGFTGYFTIQRGANDARTVEMERYVDMKKEGWWSGDLHIHRPLKDIELLMRAEDLHAGPVITWWNKTNPWHDSVPAQRVTRFDTHRFYDVMGGEDEREGGALLFFGLSRPLPIQDAEREYPSPVEFLQQARAQAGVHVDVEKPFWWDVPVWLATGQVDSIGIAHNHMWRNGVLDNEAWGRPRDTSLYPNLSGNGRWSHDIYFHALNCGLRIPPSAGSASGVLPNPVGYNRVYVHCGDEFSPESWWQGLREGKVVVTNGPMLRPQVNGQLPGHVFRAAEGETVKLSIALNFSLREPSSYLEVIKDGQVIYDVRLEDYKNRQGQLPDVEFSQSGWLMVRAVTDHPETFRFAATGPYYVEIGGKKRIQRKSAEFFRDWVYERARRLKLDDPRQKAEVLRHHRAARDYWENLVAQGEDP